MTQQPQNGNLVKYGRTLHARISLGSTSDDRFIPEGYVRTFANKGRHILTEKLDGQNDCFKKSGLYARSHTEPSTHPWDKPLVERWKKIKDSLGTLEVFGENMYAVHSIEYRKLDSFFYVFAVRDGDYWLSWDEVCFYAAMLDFPTVPTIDIKTPLSDFTSKYKDENTALEKWLHDSLGMSWVDYTTTEGRLGGCDTLDGRPASEGFVIRDAEGIENTSNELSSLFKIVREKHVKTDTHWSREWRKADLVDYGKYHWYDH